MPRDKTHSHTPLLHLHNNFESSILAHRIAQTGNMNIIHLVSNKVWGGGEQYVLDLSLESVADGNSVTIVSRDIPAVAGRYKDAGLPVITMPLKGAIDIVSPWRLARLLRKEQQAIVHVHNFKDATVAIRARKLSGNRNIRIVMTRHLVKPGKQMSLYNRLDALIFVSHLAKNEFMSTSPVIDSAKVHVIHNSIRYTGAATPSERGAGLTLMFHGRLSPEKGIETLIKAFATIENKDTRLIIVGSGNEEYVRELHSLAEAGGVAERIEWTGHSNDIHPLIEKADIGICPSHVREAGALSVIEYLAHGKPVIASNNGAQPEYVTSGTNGILVEPGDTQALAEAIATLSDSTVRDTMGKAARERYEKHLSYPIFFEKIKKVYKTVLNK